MSDAVRLVRGDGAGAGHGELARRYGELRGEGPDGDLRPGRPAGVLPGRAPVGRRHPRGDEGVRRLRGARPRGCPGRPDRRKRPWASSGFANVLDQCLGVRPGEQVVLLTDDGTDAEVVTRLLEAIAARDGIPLVAQMPAPHLPGAEPPGAVAAMMAEAAAIIELTSLFIGSSRARRERDRPRRPLPGHARGAAGHVPDGGPLDVDFEQLRADAEHVGRAWGRRQRVPADHPRRAPTCAARWTTGPAGCCTGSRASRAPTWRRPTSSRAPHRWRAPPPAWS